MKKTVLALSLFITSWASHAQVIETLNSYGQLAQKASQEIKVESFEQINQSSAQLVELAKKILPAFSKNNPKCVDYLNTVMAAADSMQSLTLEQIEADYHLDGKLPTLTSGDCYHAKDLLVHPATVVVMSKTLADNKENRRQMAHELTEVIQHLGLVKNAVQ